MFYVWRLGKTYLHLSVISQSEYNSVKINRPWQMSNIIVQTASEHQITWQQFGGSAQHSYNDTQVSQTSASGTARGKALATGTRRRRGPVGLGIGSEVIDGPSWDPRCRWGGDERPRRGRPSCRSSSAWRWYSSPDPLAGFFLRSGWLTQNFGWYPAEPDFVVNLQIRLKSGWWKINSADAKINIIFTTRFRQNDFSFLVSSDVLTFALTFT